MNWNNLSVFSFNFFDENAIDVFQTNNFIRSNSEESFFILSFDILSVYIDKFREMNLSFTLALIFREKRHLYFSFFNSLNVQLNGVNNSHGPGSMDIKELPHLILKDTEIDIVLVAPSSDSDWITETVDCFSRVASSPHPVDCENSWVIPAINQVLENESMQGSLRQHSVCDVEPWVFPDIWFVEI